MTGFQLPTYQTPASGWVLVDYKPRLILTSGPADANGTATATGPAVDPGFMWQIQRAVVSDSGTAAAQVRLYDGPSTDPTCLLSGSNSGAYDEAEYPLGLLVDQSRQLFAVWSGATPGSIGTLRLQVAVLQWRGSS